MFAFSFNKKNWVDSQFEKVQLKKNSLARRFFETKKEK
jgi:hypothetical protein